MNPDILTVPTAATQSLHTLQPSFAPVAVEAEIGRYRLRLASSSADREAACRLRFRVFNMELGEGLDSAYETGIDADRFDDVCDHLLVEDKQEANPLRRVVGTYRMQSGTTADRGFGYYSGQEFELAVYEPLRQSILELGRASIDREHRTSEVLMLLWRGIALYAGGLGLRYLIGCSSLHSRNPLEGWQVYRQLKSFWVSPEFMTISTAAFACPTEWQPGTQQPGSPAGPLSEAVKVPRLLKTYLAMGARIAAPPAWDRAFGTIDFLTFVDLESLSPAARNRFLGPLHP